MSLSLFRDCFKALELDDEYSEAVFFLNRKQKEVFSVMCLMLVEQLQIEIVEQGRGEKKGPKTQVQLLLPVFLGELRHCDSSERLNQLWFSSNFKVQVCLSNLIRKSTL